MMSTNLQWQQKVIADKYMPLYESEVERQYEAEHVQHHRTVPSRRVPVDERGDVSPTISFTIDECLQHQKAPVDLFESTADVLRPEDYDNKVVRVMPEFGTAVASRTNRRDMEAEAGSDLLSTHLANESERNNPTAAKFGPLYLDNTLPPYPGLTEYGGEKYDWEEGLNVPVEESSGSFRMRKYSVDYRSPFQGDENKFMIHVNGNGGRLRIPTSLGKITHNLLVNVFGMVTLCYNNEDDSAPSVYCGIGKQLYLLMDLYYCHKLPSSKVPPTPIPRPCLDFLTEMVVRQLHGPVSKLMDCMVVETDRYRCQGMHLHDAMEQAVMVVGGRLHGRRGMSSQGFKTIGAMLLGDYIAGQNPNCSTYYVLDRTRGRRKYNSAVASSPFMYPLPCNLQPIYHGFPECPERREMRCRVMINSLNEIFVDMGYVVNRILEFAGFDEHEMNILRRNAAQPHPIVGTFGPVPISSQEEIELDQKAVASIRLAQSAPDRQVRPRVDLV